MTEEQSYIQNKQLQLQEKSLEQSKQSVIEPAKAATGSMTGASADAARAAQLRRGIASTFNRPTAFSSAPATSSGATSGTGTKTGK